MVYRLKNFPPLFPVVFPGDISFAEKFLRFPGDGEPSFFLKGILRLMFCSLFPAYLLCVAFPVCLKGFFSGILYFFGYFFAKKIPGVLFPVFFPGGGAFVLDFSKHAKKISGALFRYFFRGV